MGGPGSGRRSWRPSVAESRALAIGELCDGDRCRRQREGEVVWYRPGQDSTDGRLIYEVRWGDYGEAFILYYRYWSSPGAQVDGGCIDLDCEPGRRSFAFCPSCARRVRTLYAPPGQSWFLCRFCHGLVYRRSASLKLLKIASALVAQARAELEALPAESRRRAPPAYVEGPPPELALRLALLLPLAPQELRLWSLRLRALGLSYRQIAALTESSKSSVARYCAAGPAAVDLVALGCEYMGRVAEGRLVPGEIDPRAVDAYLAVLRRRMQYRRPSEPPFGEERRIVILAENSG